MLWGSAFPVGKSALGYLDPWSFAGLRFTLAGLFLLAASVFIDHSPLKVHAGTGQKGRTPARWGYVMLLGLLSTSIFYGLFFMGVKRTSASSAAAVDSASPIIQALLAHQFLKHDRLSWRKLLALGTAFSGIMIVALFKSHHAAGAQVSTAGCMLILAGLFFGGLGTMMVIRYTGSLSLMRLTGFQMTFGGTLLMALSYWQGRGIDWHHVVGWKLPAMMLWLALVSAVAFRIWYGIVRRYKVTSLSVFSFLSGTWGVIMSIIFLGDPVTMPLIMGGCLVIAGVLQMHLSGEKYERPVVAETAST